MREIGEQKLIKEAKASAIKMSKIAVIEHPTHPKDRDSRAL